MTFPIQAAAGKTDLFDKLEAYFQFSTPRNHPVFNSSLFNYTLLHAINGPRLIEQREKLQHSSLADKITLGLGAGFGSFFQSFSVVLGVGALWNKLKLPEGKQPKPEVEAKLYKFSRVVVRAPILEELLFRGIVQNGLLYYMFYRLYQTSDSKENLTLEGPKLHPSQVIVLSNMLFAAAHLKNAGKLLSSKGAILQSTSIALLPNFSILYYITGDLVAPIISHATNNGLVFALLSLGKSYSLKHKIRRF